MRTAGQAGTATASGPNLTGGANAYTLYDSGTVAISVNGGAPVHASCGNGSSGTSIASTLASGPPSFSAGLSGGSLSGGTGASPGTAYSFSVTYTPNSNVLSANDSANGNWSYTYDDFNRLVGSNKNSGQQTYNYLYDRFGNRWQQNAPQGGSSFLATFTTGNNRMDGVSHDAAGNVSQDPTTGANYTYDAENRIVGVNGTSVTYTYDADGQRVEKNVGGVKTDYLYDLSGHAVADISGAGTVNRQELFAGGSTWAHTPTTPPTSATATGWVQSAPAAT